MTWQKNVVHAGCSQWVVLEQLGENHYRVLIDGKEHELEVTRRAPGIVEFSYQGRSHVARGAQAAEKLQVRMDGQTWSFEVADRQRVASSEESGGEIYAPMTGTVLQVLVKEGDRVAAGQTLVLLSAMKMEHRLVARIAGVVVKLHAEEGANIDQGHLLVCIESVE